MAIKTRNIGKAAETQPELNLPPGDNIPLAPKDLLLDSGNLRLLERGRDLLETPAEDIGQPAVQRAVERALYATDSFDVQGLARSIASNSFLKHERLIVVNYDGNNYLVLEGNRRLAAVRSLIEKVGIDKLPPAVQKSLQSLPCFVLAGDPILDRTLKNFRSVAESRLRDYRRAASIYIGLRHLMGSKSWEPASRYEFQADLILREDWTPGTGCHALWEKDWRGPKRSPGTSPISRLSRVGEI